MHRVFVLFLIASLVLPAVPVSGCECGQEQTNQSNSCCCRKSDSDQINKVKSCCCQSLQQSEKQQTQRMSRTSCEKKNCHCQQTFSQFATISSVKSTKLVRQSRCSFKSVNLASEPLFAGRSASSITCEMSSPRNSYSSREFCAYFCLWLI